MIFVEDILDNVLFYVYLITYHKIDSIKIVSKTFYKSMLNIFNKYNIKENILIATNMKFYRPELDQIEYVNNDFIIFDDFSYVSKWLHSSDNIEHYLYHSYEPYITKEILIIYNNRLMGEHYIQYIYADTKSGYDLTNIDKLNFTEYIIYYFYIDCIYCYVIDFIILPYFDERILQKKTFLHYKKIKINTFYDHNIKKINNIYF
mgnify:CR=1 FL=1|tara:strand:+ start:117 stop:728 length:612 start_codon:yes stop_codon:yes gene_type:complete